MPPYEGLLASLTSDPNPAVRRRAALRLGGTTQTTLSIAALRSALGDEHSDVRRAATVSLVRAGDIKTTARALKNVGSEDDELAIEAAQLLARARYVMGVPRLLEVFRRAKSPVAAAIAEALGELGDRMAVPMLCLAVDNRFAAPACCFALGRIGDSRALFTLIRAFKHGTGADLRAAAARGMGLIRRRDQQPHDPATWNKVLPILRLAIDDPERAVRVNVAVALWDLGERDLPSASIREIEEITTQMGLKRPTTGGCLTDEPTLLIDSLGVIAPRSTPDEQTAVA